MPSLFCSGSSSKTKNETQLTTVTRAALFTKKKERENHAVSVAMTSGKQQTAGIVSPHEHDVLSGRGNFVNYHAGNEHFRALVRKHKVEYVKCPKPQKGKFSRMIVDEIRSRNPPGRFLKQDEKTKLWYEIGEKKALDKTRQALREGAPDIMKDITGDDESGDEEIDGLGAVHKVRSSHYVQRSRYKTERSCYVGLLDCLHYVLNADLFVTSLSTGCISCDGSFWRPIRRLRR